VSAKAIVEEGKSDRGGGIVAVVDGSSDGGIGIVAVEDGEDTVED
jgi:hypothetical protein